MISADKDVLGISKDIRKHFHEQLRELWRMDTWLRSFSQSSITVEDGGSKQSHTLLGQLMEKFSKHGVKWAKRLAAEMSLA